MRLLLFSAGLMFATGAGWAVSLPSANPANGWLIAACASLGMLLRALDRIEVRS